MKSCIDGSYQEINLDSQLYSINRVGEDLEIKNRCDPSESQITLHITDENFCVSSPQVPFHVVSFVHSIIRKFHFNRDYIK